MTRPVARPSDPPESVGLAQRVLAGARRSPTAVAIVDGDRTLDYSELDAASSAVARALRHRGVRPGDAVAICLPRSWQLICAMLGVLRVGAIVVPIDVTSPAPRQRHMVVDSESRVMIHGDAAPDGLSDDVELLSVADLLESDEAERGDPWPVFAGAPFSFLFYTSGSTGHPKGVQVRDAGILRLARPGYIDLGERARYACMSNPAFDALSFEVWVPLLTGGCCVVISDDVVSTPHRLAAALLGERIDTMWVTSALFNTVVAEVPDCFAGVGQVLVGGEQLNAKVIRRWYADNAASATRLYNGYGPTETTTFALCYPIPRDFADDVVPIGRPLPGTEVVVVADGVRPAEPGEIGELYIGGDGLAAGYGKLPEETTARFGPLHWLDDGASRFYRTGDCVRSDSDGLIEFVSRADRQVKVRGFRIEPGEVERQILTHPAVRHAYVCTRRDAADATNELLAYVVLGDELTFDVLDQHLAAALPPAMRPHRIHVVDALPLTANGKVDQESLLRHTGEPWRPDDDFPSAATAWQLEVLHLAEATLGVPLLRPDDRWVAHGGDSLTAIRLCAEIRQRWGCELPPSAVLHGDLAELAATIAAGRAEGRSHRQIPGPGPVAASGARSGRATSEQQRLWLLQQQSPQSCAYNVGITFRVRGAVAVTALREALRQVVVRHPALRTAFEATPEGLLQVVGDPYDPWIEPDQQSCRDEVGWRAFARDLFATPFDLARPQLLQACWIGPGCDDTDGRPGGVLLLHMHHIAIDGWSLNILLRDLSASYALGSGDPQPVDVTTLTPLDHADWQADLFSRPDYVQRRAALQAHYAAQDEVSAPLEARRVQDRTIGKLRHSSIEPSRRAQLDRLGAELGMTRFQVLFAVFTWGVYGATGHARPRVASPVANRQAPEFELSVGMFVNTMLMTPRLLPHESLSAQLQRQGVDLQSVLDRQDVALAHVLTDTDFRTDERLFDFMFVAENTDFAALTLQGCETQPEWLDRADTKCPLTVSVVTDGAGLHLVWEYADDFFSAAEIDAMVAVFADGLDALLAGRPMTLAQLVAPYRAGLMNNGVGPSMPLVHTTVAEAFAAQVSRTPDAIALVSDDRCVTYDELDAHAAALAAELLSRFPAPARTDLPRRVALHFEASVEHIVALLALARLNITIVPLDPAYPPALLRQILAQVEPLCILHRPGEEEALATLASAEIPRHPVLLSTAVAADLPSHAGRPLYTLFTSGSTGVPKGVQVPDRTVCNMLQWQNESCGLPASAVTMQFSMLSFDVSFQEIFATLCAGGSLHLIRPGWRQDGAALLAYLEEGGIERIYMPYVALQLLAEHGVRLGRFPSRLRDVITAGEQLLCTDAIRRWFAGMPGARLFNQYGPSETFQVTNLCLDGDPALWPSRPGIGEPVANGRLCVVDDAGELVPPGCTGQLLVGGMMATPCYLDDPMLNAARFVELLGLGLFYRTGDLARFDRQGMLHFLGRDDQQIKLSGYRLELGQVEAALLQHPAITNAVVVLDGGQLVACLHCTSEVPALPDVTRHLATLLPAYVRIDRFRRLETLPRTPSGKIDRRRVLSAPGTDMRPHTFAAPVLTRREQRLTELLTEEVGQVVGPDQHFFDAGATSLDLMRFHLRCSAEVGDALTISDVFEHTTIRRLASFLDRQPGAMPVGVPQADTRPVEEPVAIVGMAVRVPGAANLRAFWEMVTAGGRGIEHFPAAEGLVGARSQMPGLLAFDPGRFGISRQEARLMDPQQRHLLMSCVEAVAHVGIADPARHRIGVVASSDENTYVEAMLRDGDPTLIPDRFQLSLHNDRDFLATKVAYHLGLTGPAFTVQAACASSLVAVHVAAGMLRNGDAEVMLAGGVLADSGLTEGYRHRPHHIYSEDGHCRPFSDDAGGTVAGSGVGVVVLKQLRRAESDGNTIYAVITGSALNNDGAGKLSYTAPSVVGQRDVISAALGRAGRSGADLGYVEAHGTGTKLGDPVEVAALRQAYDTAESQRCALASVKSQIGHLGAAAGVIGLVRATLAVHHGLIPPNVDFRQTNPHIGPDPTPFYIPTVARPWPADRPRVAAVSSLGIGGTNAHVILEAGEQTRTLPIGVPLLTLSSCSAAGLLADAVQVANHLATHPESYDQVLRHLQAGRPQHRWRVAAVCVDPGSAVAWLRAITAAALSLVTDDGRTCESIDESAEALASAWLIGATIDWPAGPAPAPWDFPPPAFDLADFDVEHAAPTVSQPAVNADGWPLRRPEADWLHQPHWVRMRRAGVGAPEAELLVVMTSDPLSSKALQAFEGGRGRVVQVCAGIASAQLGDDLHQLDPNDPNALRQLLNTLAREGHDNADWLHLLPLSVTGAAGPESLAQARWACLDTPVALLQALGDAASLRVRPWWLSYGAQPVDGPVERPELGLLAGVHEVGRQESGIVGHWLDVPSPDPAEWASAVVALLASARAGEDLPGRLALRDEYWWRSAMLPVPTTSPSARSEFFASGGVHLVIGGTGGIGRSIAGWLLAQSGSRVIALSRRGRLPAELEPWADRVDVLAADLTDADPESIIAGIGQHTDRLDSVIHAAGSMSGGLIALRDPVKMQHAMAATHHGALLVEQLIERYRPAVAVYCSSMSAHLGGVGQLEYAAANGLLDGFARHGGDAPGSARLGINWDVWSDVGMALRIPQADVAHRAHLSVGLTTGEAQRVFDRALRLQLPQLLVSTTDLDESVRFYAPVPRARRARENSAADGVDALKHLSEFLCQRLGMVELDPVASLHDLGAESLTLLDVIAEVHERFGVDIALAQLSHRVSLNEILALVAESTPRDRLPSAEDPVELQVWQEGGTDTVLCLIHPVGGDVQAYRALVANLDPQITVCLIADPRLHRPELPDWSLAERARRYGAALLSRFPRQGWRWQLAGWSFGAWVALTMAADAEAAGRPVDGLHLLDPPQPGTNPTVAGHDESQLAAIFAQELSHSSVGAHQNTNATAYAQQLARQAEVNLAGMAAHTLPALSATPTRVWLAGRAGPGLPGPVPFDAQRRSWQAHLPQHVLWRVLDTTHYGIVRPPHVGQVADAITAASLPIGDAVRADAARPFRERGRPA